MISHILDTCAVLDLACGRWSNNSAKKELRGAEDPVVPCLAIWEISRKLRVGKLELPCEVDGVLEFVEAICERHKLRIQSLTKEICHQAELLPPLHEDPFDRMIIATAQQYRCPVFTTDRRFLDYPINVISQRK